MTRSDSSFEALDDQDCGVCGYRFDLEGDRCPSCGTLVEPPAEDVVPRVSASHKQAPPTTKDVPVTASSGEVLTSSASLEALSGDDLPLETTEMNLATGVWRVLGSSLDADIVVSNSRLPPRGVRLRRVGGMVQIRPLDGAVNLLVDGEPRTGEVTVSLRDRIVEVDGVQITDEMVPQDTLAEGDLPEFFAPILIGRAPECDFVLDDSAVSARHARLVREPDGLHLEDLDSANGTYVAERRIKRTLIEWRTEFELGTVVLTALDIVQAVRSSRSANRTSVFGALAELEAPASTGSSRGRPAILGPSTTTSASVVDTGMAFATMPITQAETHLGAHLTPGSTLVVGRDQAADIVIDTPNVSRLHARIEVTEAGYLITDLGSTNGTWHNGERINKPTLVDPGSDLRVGPHRLSLSEGGRVAARQAGGVVGVRLDAHKLVREVGSASAPLRVVDEVSFSILPGEMVAIMGPSGAGKTSVLTTVAGYTPPTKGHVLLDGMSLYKHYDVFRRAIGYVPQDDVMHRSLTVDEVLYYHAKINFPAEIEDAEIHGRIDLVLRQLDLERVRDSIVGDQIQRGLSGGQRKRLNVAIELMGQPSLLLLDEPTSGLDARSAMQLIRQCRGLASGGRTVVMTIHQPRREAFDLFDKILLLTTGGKVAYFGPVTGVKRYFGERSEVPPESARNPADYVLDALDPLDDALGRAPDLWKEDYLKSPQHERFVSSRMRKDQLKAARKAARRGRTALANPVRQTWDLLRRYAVLKWRDRNALAVQMAQAPVIAALAVLLFHKGRFRPLLLQDDITPTLFVVVAAAVWFGCSNVAREVVGERAIFRRERMGSLRPGPYLLSKILGQGALIAVQVLMLLAILIPAVPLNGDLTALVGVALLAGWSAMSLGLLVSTVARTELQAIQFVPLVILPQIMLSGILLPVTGDTATKMAVVLSKPVLLRWAYGAYLQVEYAAGTIRGGKADQPFVKFWDRVGFGDDVLRTDLIVMASLGLGCAILSWLILLRRDRR